MHFGLMAVSEAKPARNPDVPGCRSRDFPGHPENYQLTYVCYLLWIGRPM
jgi:hypothetical protein